MSESGKTRGGLDVASVSSERIERFLQETPIEERGAVYAVIRMPQERTQEVAGLTQAIAHKFDKEIAIRAIHRVAALAEELRISGEALQPVLIAAIEKRPVAAGNSSPSFIIPCIDDEAAYFIDRLGLEPEVKIALIQAVNDMESKRKPDEMLGAREVAQFLEATAIELRKRLEPKYWEPMVRNYYARQRAEFDEVFDALEREGLKPTEINPAYASHKGLNVEWIRKGRAWVHAEIQGIADSEAKRMAPPPVEQLNGFMTYLQSKITPRHWQALIRALKITGTDAEGLTFATQSAEELREWKFQMERTALFLNPVNREMVATNPFHEPELAVVLNQYRRSGGAASSKGAEEAQALRSKVGLTVRIRNLEMPDPEFKQCVGQLIRESGQERSPALISVLSMIGAARKLEPAEREFVIEELDQHLRKA